MWRHRSQACILRAVAGLVSEAGLQASLEEEVPWRVGAIPIGQAHRPRGDLTVFSVPKADGTSYTAYCDVSFISVYKGDGTMQRGADKPGGVSKLREAEKHAKYANAVGGVGVPLVVEQFGRMGEGLIKFVGTLAKVQAAKALCVPYGEAKEHSSYARVHGAALNHCFMVLSVTAAREQARLIIKGAQFANRRPGGALPLAVAAVGAGVGLLSGVGLLPAQGALSTAP